jgi:hypothetical protein
MAVSSGSNQNRVEILFPDSSFQDVVAAFKRINRNYVTAKHMGAALKKAIKPGHVALKRNTPKGPTGNLKRAVASKVVKYWKQDYGWAAALAGYRRPGTGNSTSAQGGSVRKGNDRAFHQGFVEFGTQKRRTLRSNIASSFNTLGPFELEAKQSRKKVNGKYQKFLKRQGYRQVGEVVTVPKYPKAFFKRAPADEMVDLSYMPLGGTQLRRAPVRYSFNQALPMMKSLMNIEMTRQLSAAIKESWYLDSKGIKTS